MQTLVPDEILQRIRQEVAKAKYAKTPSSWRPPMATDIRRGTQILCLDQSLSNSGWALVNTDDEEGVINVVDSGTIRPPVLETKSQGFELTLTKSVMLARELQILLNTLYGRFEEVVIELPSIFGYRTESSLVAAVTISVELDRMGEPLPVLISRNSAGAVLCGDRHAPKNVSSEVVNGLVTERPAGKGQWTEHVRDAVLVGLRHLYLEAR
jgi:hypothetical protein